MLKPPALVRLNRLLLFIILTSIILYYGREFFVLLTFSGFLAMLMTPVSNRLETRIPRFLSSILSILIIIAVFAGIVILLSAQIKSITKDLPQIISALEDINLSCKILD